MEKQGTVGQSLTVAAPRRRGWEEFSGIAILVLCFGVGLMMLAVGGDPYIPRWLWAGLLTGCLLSAFLAASGLLTVPWQRLSYAVAVFSSCALLLTMPHQGMFVVVLVVVAAAGSYIIPIPAVLAVIALNCSVVLGHMVVHGVEPVEYLSVTVFYAIIHLAAMFSTYALHRESVLRAQLEQKNLELEAAGVLLESSAATAERLRIARELHDAVGHQLTVLNLELEAAKHRAAEHGDAAQLKAHISSAASVAKELLADVRATVGDLRVAGPGDLPAHLTRLAAAVPSLDIHVEVETGLLLDDQQAEALIRAAQEIITNTVKHAEARELSLELSCVNGQMVLTGTNDGWTPKSITPGNGLTGLRERVELLGGGLQISVAPHFSVQLWLPAAEFAVTGSRVGTGQSL